MITHLSAKNVPVKRTTLSSWGRSSVSSPFYDEEETRAQSTKNSEQPGLADQGSGAFMRCSASGTWGRASSTQRLSRIAARGSGRSPGVCSPWPDPSQSAPLPSELGGREHEPSRARKALTPADRPHVLSLQPGQPRTPPPAAGGGPSRGRPGRLCPCFTWRRGITWVSGRPPRCPGGPVALWDRDVGRPRGKDTAPVLGPGRQACPHPAQVSQSGEGAGESTLKGPQGLWAQRACPTLQGQRPQLRGCQGRGCTGARASPTVPSHGSDAGTLTEAWRIQAPLARPIHPSFPFYLSANRTRGILYLTRLAEKLMWEGGAGREARR